MRIFVDASAWVAKAVSTDQWAPELRRVMQELRGQRIELVTTTWTLYEALAVTRRRKHGATRLLFRDALANARVAAVEPEVEHAALQRFLQWEDQGASVVDHANALVAEQYRCEAILSFDADFIPLAAAGGIRLLR
jgi:predicted nucleic acid-binding protein